MAERLERDGADPEGIRQETGWFHGMDGKWRFEIDDSGMRYDPSGNIILTDRGDVFYDPTKIKSISAALSGDGQNLGRPASNINALNADNIPQNDIKSNTRFSFAEPVEERDGAIYIRNASRLTNEELDRIGLHMRRAGYDEPDGADWTRASIYAPPKAAAAAAAAAGGAAGLADAGPGAVGAESKVVTDFRKLLIESVVGGPEEMRRQIEADGRTRVPEGFGSMDDYTAMLARQAEAAKAERIRTAPKEDFGGGLKVLGVSVRIAGAQGGYARARSLIGSSESAREMRLKIGQFRVSSRNSLPFWKEKGM